MNVTLFSKRPMLCLYLHHNRVVWCCLIVLAAPIAAALDTPLITANTIQ